MPIYRNTFHRIRFRTLEIPEQGEDKKVKPKRASIPRGWDPATLDLDQALALLALPREVGLHPETGKPITAGIGKRFLDEINFDYTIFEVDENLMSLDDFLGRLNKRNVQIIGMGQNKLRIVTHMDYTEEKHGAFLDILTKL